MNYQAPNFGDGWSTHPNEHFFIRKFDFNTFTAKQMRKLERQEFRNRYSSKNPTFHHHIRDYHTLCRGENLVKIQNFIFSQFRTMITTNIVSF